MKGEQNILEEEISGVGGWLLIFCLVVIFVRPLVTFSSINAAWTKSDHLLRVFPEFKVMLTINTVIDVLLVLWGITVGIQLWSLSKNAVRSTRNYLVGQLAFTVLSFGLIFLFDMSPQARSVLITESIKLLIGVTIFSVFWLIYFSVSSRVNFTYTDSEETDESDVARDGEKSQDSNSGIFFHMKEHGGQNEAEFLSLLNEELGGENSVKIVSDPSHGRGEDGILPEGVCGLEVARDELTTQLIRKLINIVFHYSIKLKEEFVVGFYDDVNEVSTEIAVIRPNSDQEALFKETLIYF